MWTVDVYPRWSDSLLTSFKVESQFNARAKARAIWKDGLEYEDDAGDWHFVPGHAIDIVDFYPDD